MCYSAHHFRTTPYTLTFLLSNVGQSETCKHGPLLTCLFSGIIDYSVSLSAFYMDGLFEAGYGPSDGIYLKEPMTLNRAASRSIRSQSSALYLLFLFCFWLLETSAARMVQA